MTDVTTLLAGIKAHYECIAYADDIPEGGNEEVPEDYERHYCNEDGEDWPCANARTDVPRLVAALEAVAGLHKPFVWDFGFGPVTSCRGCADQDVSEELAAYPCPTITAVTTALRGGE